ncbi:MAG: F420-dependent NADP oxidoreductase [Bacteroidota bacterium]
MLSEKLSVSLIGLGNLAHSLIPALQNTGAEISQIISRNPEKLAYYQKEYHINQGSTQLEALKQDVDLVFLCVADGMIEEVANKLAHIGYSHPIFLHCSGSMDIRVLSALGEKVGVFYPMQIFTKDRLNAFDSLPLFLEAHEAIYPLIEKLAKKMSSRVYEMNSTDRLRLHMGAVMACNFSNYLYRMAEEVMPQKAAMDFSIYEALVREHIDKVFNFGPQNTQTGPAVRKDQATIEKHLALLEEQEDYRALYAEMSSLIQEGS